MEVKIFIIGAGVLALLAAICFACASMFLVKAGKEALGLLAQAIRAPEAPAAEQVPGKVDTLAAQAPAPGTAPSEQASAETALAGTVGCPGCDTCKPAQSKPEEEYEMLNGFLVRTREYETRADGERVRKDRWEVGMRNIAGILTGPRAGFEIDDIVEKVRVLAKEARADYDSGGNGIPGSAPVWGPCPAKCDHGSVVIDGTDTDCPECHGRGKVVLEPALTATEESK